MRRFSTIIFDFDGTLADSLGTFIRVYQSVSDTFGFRPLESGDIEKLRTMPPYKVLSYLNIPLYRLPQLLLIGQKKYREYLSDIEPIPGLRFVLMELQKRYTLHILTSNNRDTVMEFLETHDITCFETVVSEKTIFGKQYALSKMLRSLAIQSDEVLYVGDEVRDIESCKKAHIAVASVTWGLNAESILTEHHPDFIIKDPEEFLKLL